MVEIYLYDELKKKTKGSLETVFNVKTRSDFSNMLSLLNSFPFLADRWLFIIDYSKLKSSFKDSWPIFTSIVAEFLIKVKNYKDFLEVKEAMPGINDMYLAKFNKNDLEYLFHDSDIPSKLLDFVYWSYSGEPDKVFTLLEELKNGVKVQTKKDISGICGVSSGSFMSYSLYLLKDPPKSRKGFSNRLTSLYELAGIYGFPSCRNFLLASVRDIYDIKVLYLNGVIFDRVSNLPEGFDKKRLKRYSSRISTIAEIPYDRVVSLLLCISEAKWYSDLDLLNFLYSFYGKGGFVSNDIS